MSREITVDVLNRSIVEKIVSMDECKHLCNDVCCNDLCDLCGDFVDHGFCKSKCNKFEKEDGIIAEASDEADEIHI